MKSLPDYSCGSSSVYVTSQAELDAYHADFGWDGEKFAKLKVKFNPEGNVFLYSPCLIKLQGEDDYLDVSADLVCAYGDEGVQVAVDASNQDLGIDADSITLKSNEGSVIVGKNVSIGASYLEMIGARRVQVQQAGTVLVDTLVMSSTGSSPISVARLAHNVEVYADTITMSAPKTVEFGNGVSVSAVDVLLQSTGTSPGSGAGMLSTATADVLGTFSFLSNKKAYLNNDTSTTVGGEFTMDAPKCTIKPDASYSTTSTAGSCL